MLNTSTPAPIKVKPSERSSPDEFDWSFLIIIILIIFIVLIVGAIAVITLLFFKLTKPSATGFSIFLLILLTLYLTPVCCAVFDPKKGVRDLLKRVWRVGVERFYYFILPVLAAFGILLLLAMIISSISLYVFPDIGVWFLLAAFVVWQSWFKYYFYFVARKIK